MDDHESPHHDAILACIMIAGVNKPERIVAELTNFFCRIRVSPMEGKPKTQHEAFWYEVEHGLLKDVTWPPFKKQIDDGTRRS